MANIESYEDLIIRQRNRGQIRRMDHRRRPAAHRSRRARAARRLLPRCRVSPEQEHGLVRQGHLAGAARNGIRPEDGIDERRYGCGSAA